MVSHSSCTCLFTTFAAIIVLLGTTEAAVFIPILQQDQQHNPVDGSYSYSYGTANGIIAQEQGKHYNLGPDNVAKTVDGSYSYVNDDGTLVNVKYVADENGFHAVRSIGYRAQAVPRLNAYPGAPVYFQNYDSLRYALRL